MKNWLVKSIAALIMSLFLVPSVMAQDENWWDKDFQYRKKITFNTTSGGANIKTNQSDVPVLLRLHPGNFSFTNCKEGGEDIRFIAADNKTILKHTIERFDTLEEMSLIWVKLPRLSGASESDFVYMYYGNESAAGGQDSGGTFMGSSVFHFTETEGKPKDATRNGNDSDLFKGGLGLPGVIGNGVSFNGISDQLTIKANHTLDMSGGFSVSAWIKMPASQENGMIFKRRGASANLMIGIDRTKLYCEITTADRIYVTEKTADLSPQSWHLFAVTGTPDGVVAVYVDGIKIDWINLNSRLPLFTEDLMIAGDSVENTFFAGEMDELRIESIALSEDRIRADYMTQGADNNFYSISQETAGAGGNSLPVFYLGTIFKNITIDGWLVIICLMVLGIMSCVIVLNKSIFLYLMNKENMAFKRINGGDTFVSGFRDEDSEFENSSLFRLYRKGTGVIEGFVNPQEEKSEPLLPKQAEIMKSELEKGLIEESGKMNAWLLVLTMSISGGPFLGLLGTVWGVMNTFAAMAEAGEANIMAIAPGVASALSTTVFGLIVAIPALFGYSYLSSRIRKITIDLTIYVDDFCKAVDNRYC